MAILHSIYKAGCFQLFQVKYMAEGYNWRLVLYLDTWPSPRCSSIIFSNKHTVCPFLNRGSIQWTLNKCASLAIDWLEISEGALLLYLCVFQFNWLVKYQEALMGNACRLLLMNVFATKHTIWGVGGSYSPSLTPYLGNFPAWWAHTFNASFYLEHLHRYTNTHHMEKWCVLNNNHFQANFSQVIKSML